MKLYFDTSALIKKYINEKGSEKVDVLFDKAEVIYISNITEIETLSTFKRLLVENEINEEEFDNLKKEINIDFSFFDIIIFDESIKEISKKIIERYQLKSLDSIQLGTVKSIEDFIDFFVVCDKKLIDSGIKEELKIINPLE